MTSILSLSARSTCRRCSAILPGLRSRSLNTPLSLPLTASHTPLNPLRTQRLPKRNQFNRSFFSLTDVARLLPGQETDQGDDLQTFDARKILPYSQEQLYSIVADVPSYSSFIPFCTSSTIVSGDASTSPKPISSSARDSSQEIHIDRLHPFDVQAELEVGFGAFTERFTSRVEGTPYEIVKATAVDSPLFSDLTTTWSFTPASVSSPHPTNTPTSTATPTAVSSPLSNAPSSGPTMLSISLSFSFNNPLHRMASQAFLPRVSDLMVEAFEKRCLEVYGKGSM